LRNIALKLRFRGTAYHGWQSQKNALSIQDVISEAIHRVTGGRPLPELAGCGRTDAGVHAIRYVASFRTGSGIPADRLPPALNAYLPRDIAIYDAREMGENFNARFSCQKKEYLYRIYTGRQRNPFYSDLAYHCPQPLDEGLMAQAAGCFVGTHDFSAFRATGSGVKGSRCTVFDCRLEREGEMLTLTVCADGFVYNMARIIAGTVLYVGASKIGIGEIEEIIASKKRERAGVTLPPCGLYLSRATYGERTLDE